MPVYKTLICREIIIPKAKFAGDISPFSHRGNEITLTVGGGEVIILSKKSDG